MLINWQVISKVYMVTISFMLMMSTGITSANPKGVLNIKQGQDPINIQTEKDLNGEIVNKRSVSEPVKTKSLKVNKLGVINDGGGEADPVKYKSNENLKEYIINHENHAYYGYESFNNVRFKIFDEAGRELSYEQVVARMSNNKGSDYLDDGVVEIDTLKVISLYNQFKKQGYFAMPVTAAARNNKYGYMVHWNTENTGYSTFLLDNLGRGFKKDETIIFNQRLAYDAKRQFEIALKQKPDYQPSPNFKKSLTTINACFNKLNQATTDKDKGMYGQRCLDLTAQAMELLLTEYGMQAARGHSNSARWGMTLYPNTHYEDKSYSELDKIVELFDKQHRWVRITMNGRNFNEYPIIYNMLNYAEINNIKTMGQLFDSEYQSEISLNEFRQLVNKTLDYPSFERFNAWEVGNAVNLSWLGTNMRKKVEYATLKTKEKFPNSDICLSMMWTSIEDKVSSSIFNWINDNVNKTIMENIDCVGLDVDVSRYPLGFSWDLVMNQFAKVFPGKKIIIASMAYSDEYEENIFKEGPLDRNEAIGSIDFIKNRYAAAFILPRSLGGFMSYYDEVLFDKTNLWYSLREFYCEIYPNHCSREVDQQSSSRVDKDKNAL